MDIGEDSMIKKRRQVKYRGEEREKESGKKERREETRIKERKQEERSVLCSKIQSRQLEKLRQLELWLKPHNEMN